MKPRCHLNREYKRRILIIFYFSSHFFLFFREVDRIYTPTTGKSNLEVAVCTGDDGSKVSLKAGASDGEKEIPMSAAVWNPYIEKAQRLGDFDDEEYRDMLCVEPGILCGMDSLPAGKKVSFEQVINSV